jgi:hypothetical protein
VKCLNCGKDYTTGDCPNYCSFCGSALGTNPGDRMDSEKAPDENDTGLKWFNTAQDSRKHYYCPWEDIESIGFFQGLAQTLKQSLGSPRDFFSHMPPHGGYSNPLLYCIIIETLGTLAAYLWGIAVGNPLVAAGDMSRTTMVLLGIFVPVMVIIWTFFWSVVLHGTLRILAGPGKSFEGTFRVVAYSSGPELLSVIPYVGSFAAIFLKLYLSIVGLREVHGLTSSKATLIVLLPGILLFIILLSLAVALGVMIAMALG